MNKTLVVAIAAVLVGGVAVAAYQTTRGDYAEVIEAKPVTQQVDVFAQVVSATPVTQMVTGTREVCEDRQVEYTSNETRDPNKITGTVAGAVIGGAIGNQVGGGSGRRLATAAGAVGGAFAGREIQDRRQEANRRVEVRTEQVCRTETQPREQVIGYDVTYNLDGQVSTMRTERKPGEQMPMGQREETIGYDVTYRYDGQVGHVRTETDPGRRLPVQNGTVMVPASGG